jgi:hypothetical protein
VYRRGTDGELDTFVVTLSGFTYTVWQFVAVTSCKATKCTLFKINVLIKLFNEELN